MQEKYSNSMGKLFFSFVVGISCGIALCDLSHFIKEAFSLSGQTMIHKKYAIVDFFLSYFVPCPMHCVINADFCFIVWK